MTALDAGFATAMDIKPKWIRDIFSVAFTGYYLLFASEADEKVSFLYAHASSSLADRFADSQLRKYRTMCTVEMLRATWEKTSNPYVRWFTSRHRPRIGTRRRILLARPKSSTYT